MKREIHIHALTIALIAIGSHACRSDTVSTKPTASEKPEIKTIRLQPLGKVDDRYVKAVESSVREFYGYECETGKPQELTEELLSDSRKRYSASKILKRYNGSGNVLVLMEEDIAVHDTARSNPEWGIIGLGYRPGNTCVVSTFRLERKVSKSKAEERLRKVAIHEIGHNLGIDHCTSNPECLMNDANGTVTQIDREKMFICERCRESVRL